MTVRGQTVPPPLAPKGVFYQGQCVCVCLRFSLKQQQKSTRRNRAGMGPKKRNVPSPAPLGNQKRGKRDSENNPPPEEDVARDQKLPGRDDLLVSDGSDDNSEDEWLLDAEKSKWGKKVRGPLK